jgi:hypothetical protein
MINRRTLIAGLTGATLSTSSFAESKEEYLQIPIYMIRMENYGVSYFLELAKDLNKAGIEVYQNEPEPLWDTFVEATYKINGDFKLTVATLDENGVQDKKIFRSGNLYDFVKR